MGASVSIMATHSYDKIQNRPKLTKCNRNILSASGKALITVGECFIQLQIDQKLFRDRTMVIQNLKCEYILGQVLHRAYRFSTCYSTTGKHYRMINGEMIAEAITQVTDKPIINTQCKITLPPMSVSVLSVHMPPLCNTNNIYKLNFNTFQLPEKVIPLNVIHRVDHKTPQNLNIPRLNTINSFCSIPRTSPIATLAVAGKCEEIQKVGWNQVQCNTAQLLTEILEDTSLQLEPHTKCPLRSI